MILTERTARKILENSHYTLLKETADKVVNMISFKCTLKFNMEDISSTYSLTDSENLYSDIDEFLRGDLCDEIRNEIEDCSNITENKAYYTFLKQFDAIRKGDEESYYDTISVIIDDYHIEFNIDNIQIPSNVSIEEDSLNDAWNAYCSDPIITEIIDLIKSDMENNTDLLDNDDSIESEIEGILTDAEVDSKVTVNISEENDDIEEVEDDDIE